jgi:hypothetical protein
VAGRTVLFDASVLYAAPVRDLLLELALSDLFRAKWTEQINDEWMSHLLANRPDLTAAQLARTRVRKEAFRPQHASPHPCASCNTCPIVYAMMESRLCAQAEHKPGKGAR